MQKQTIEMPMQIPSRANANLHHFKRAALVQRQRKLVLSDLRFLAVHPGLPCTIELVRVAPRPLDDDNLRGALKAHRDAVAEWLGCKDDRDPQVRWLYGQRKDRRPGYTAAAITIVQGQHDCPCCGGWMLSEVDVA